MKVCWPPTCTCMRMQVVKSSVHMPSVRAGMCGQHSTPSDQPLNLLCYPWLM